MSYGSVNSSEDPTKGSNAFVQPSQARHDGAESGSSPSVGGQAAEPAPGQGERQSAWEKFRGFYERNIGLFFVFLAQVFASLVREAACTRLSGGPC